MSDTITRRGLFMLGHLTSGYEPYNEPEQALSYLLCNDNSVKDYTINQINDVIAGWKSFQNGKHLVFIEIVPEKTIASFMEEGAKIRLRQEEEERIRSERAKKANETRRLKKAKKEQEELERLAKKLGKQVV